MALVLAGCAGGAGGGADVPDADVVIGGEELNFGYSCIRDPDNPQAFLVSATGLDVDDLAAQFGYPDREDRVAVNYDDDSWQAGDGLGEITSVDYDVAGPYARGEAVFESTSGATLEGSFNLDCS